MLRRKMILGSVGLGALAISGLGAGAYRYSTGRRGAFSEFDGMDREIFPEEPFQEDLDTPFDAASRLEQRQYAHDPVHAGH